MAGDVLAAVEGPVGRLRLNRPRALHSLTTGMCAAMIAALVAWRDDPAVRLVLLDHAASPDGDPRLSRGFCAGGDVRAAAGDPVAARAFFHAEYRLNHLLFTYPKPVVAAMDGIVMGGGVGIALPATCRIATERTVFAMPEATIGLFPDVGGGRYLSRLPGRIGRYLALTAARLDGGECLALGLATHLVASGRLEEVKACLVAGEDVAAVLDDAAAPGAAAPILAARAEIDRRFAADTLEEVIAACAGTEYAGMFATKSPLSCKVALRLLAESAGRDDFAAEMAAEYAIAVRMAAAHDFREGVRALLVDRDNAPRWNPATPECVTADMLDAIFAPLPAGQAWTPLEDHP